MKNTEFSMKVLQIGSISAMSIGVGGALIFGFGLIYFFVTGDKTFLSFLS